MEQTKVRSHHAAIAITRDGVVTKAIEPDYTFGSHEEKDNLRKQILTYRTLLIGHSIPVAETYELDIHDDGILRERTVDCGLDGYEIIKRGGVGKVRPKDVVRSIARAVLPILKQPTIRVTIDPHPANWCFDREGVVRYIDFHPARFVQGNLHLVGFPQPTNSGEYQYATQRYFSPLGIIRSLRFNAVRAGGRAVEEVLFEEINRYPEDVRAKYEYDLLHLPEQRLRRQGDGLVDILKEIDVWRIDSLREIALVVADSMEPSTAETFLTQILELSRVDFNLDVSIRSSRVEEAKKIICRNARAELRSAAA